MDSYITKLQEIELIAGDSGIVFEFQVFYEDGEPLDLQDVLSLSGGQYSRISSMLHFNT